MNVKEAQQFVADFSKGEYNPTEHAAFLRWLRSASASELDVIADEHEAHQGEWVFSAEEPSPEWVEALEERLDRLAEKREMAPVVAMPFGKKVFGIVSKPWIAVASIATLIVAGAVLYNYKQTGGSLNGEDRSQILATLTQTTTVVKGGEVSSVVLPDGSKVWLNVASTLKYPKTFSGKDRVVELSGEAYFEVTPRSDMPFRVLFRNAEVKVLGTHFNIMAYYDEPVARTSLIDGSVSVESGSQTVTLQPGEQGEIPYSSPGVTGPIKVIPGIDPRNVLAWENGDLKFENTGLRAVMRTLARCYNVETQVDPNVPDKAVTTLFSRSDGLNKAIKGLEGLLEQEHLQFINQGTKVRVTLAK